MGNFFISLFVQIIGGAFQICFSLVQTLVPWVFRHPFYLSNGFLLAALAPMVHPNTDTLLAFGIGVGIAAVLDWFLSKFDLIYRQIVFGSLGFAAGYLLNMGPFPCLALAGLSVWQSQRSLY